MLMRINAHKLGVVKENTLNFTQLQPEQRQAFEEDGFLTVRHALDSETVARLIEVGDRLAAPFLNKAEVLNKPWHNDLDLRPGVLKEDAFYKLIAHSSTVPLVVQLLSPNIHLLSTDIIYKKPEAPDLPPFRRGWHRDLRMPKDVGHQSQPRLGIKVCYCLTDFHGSDSGLTLMARTSQLRTHPLVIPKGQVDPPDLEVCHLDMNAGDALLFENRIYHTATPNRTNRISKKVMFGYAYRWMKPEVYLDVPDERLLEKADPITRQLLGGYRDVDTRPWALQAWAMRHGVHPEPVPWMVEG